MRLLTLLIGLLLIAPLLPACGPERPSALSPYAPSELPPVMPTGDFDAYVDAARAQVTTVNRAMGAPLGPVAVEAIGPFEIRPGQFHDQCRKGRFADYDKGVLLIHGLNDTPFSMRDLGRRFADACYLVRAIILPGHGSVPGDLLAIGLPAWRDAVAKAVWGFRGKADRLVIAGFDLGADLALDAALDLGLPPELELDGIVMLAPAFAYQAPSFAPAAAGPGGDALWGDVFSETETLRYLSVAKPAVAEVNRLGSTLFERQAPMQIPLFMVASADDDVADPALAQDWFCSQATTPRRLLWYTRYPGRGIPNCRCLVRHRDPAEDRLKQCAFTRASAHGPPSHGDGVGLRPIEEGGGEHAGEEVVEQPGGRAILDLSHVALLAAPDNPRYGAASGRRDCLHYSWERETPEELVCSGALVGAGEGYLRYGESSESNLRNYILRRLTYNPDFDHMATAILEFLDKTD